MTLRRTAALTAATVVALASCAAPSPPIAPVNPTELTAAVTERLEVEIDVPFDVDCPEALLAKVGASVSCTVTSPTSSEGDVMVIVTVTSVDPLTGVVEFDLTADPMLQPSDEESPEDSDGPSASDDAGS